MITYEEVRQFLASRSPISSNLGTMLDRMREGRCTGSGDIRYAQMKDERERLRLARLIRCIDGLASTPSLRQARDKFSIADIHAFARRAKMGDGEAVVRVLYCYEEWSSQWPEKGLAAVYQWAQTKCARLEAPVTEPEEELAQTFRQGRAPKARQFASALVADAHVALGEWVRVFSKREGERDARRLAAS